ncbi:replication initiation negative regulator SeqA [Alteromonas sp. CYL-A6]|uniref:replication initiation negative regulator SeqA n=1 Tax=Alteromonas nitratireducens TaxID=3390813 RepID=UPI0034AACF10
MKSIDIDDDLYAFIAAQTKHIGESASDILRRLLLGDGAGSTPAPAVAASTAPEVAPASSAAAEKGESAPVTNTATQASSVSENDLLDMVSPQRLASLTKRVDQFLYILGVLHAIHGESFAEVESIRGKNRTYFAQTKAALLENGSSTNPKPIPDSPYWVVTNNNTAKKMTMISQVMQRLGYEEAMINDVLARFAPDN